MDKQTGSNSSRQGTSEARDISLGCGPSQASSAAATSPSSTAAAAAAASGEGATSGGSKFATFTAQQHHQSIAPSGASMSSAAVGAAQSPQIPPPITLNINTTTGGNFSVIVDASNTVENLKKVIAKKLKVAKDRICLLHREKELQDGNLTENGLMDGSKIILIPNVETGLLAQRPENTVMQALESLNDSQVNDFLSGKTPLNLSMRLGDHMMLIQLQLSTVNPLNTAVHSNSNSNSSSSSSSRTRSTQRGSRSSSAAAGTSQSAHNHHSHHYHHHHHHTNSSAASANAMPVASTSASAAAQRKHHDSDAASNPASNTHNNHRQRMASISTMPSLRVPAEAANTLRSSDLSSFLSKRDYESLQNIVRSIAMAQPTKMAPPPTTPVAPSTAEPKHSMATTACCSKSLGSVVANVASPGFHSSEPTLLEQSPIKSLSNLVSSPIKTTAIQNIPIESSVTNSPAPATAPNGPSVEATCQDPISAKLTSCLCTQLNGANGASLASGGSLKSCIESTCQSRQDSSDAGITESPAAMLTSTPSTITSSAAIAATSSSSLSSLSLHKTANNPIVRSKHRHHHHHHHHHHHYHHHNSNGSTAGSSARKLGGNTPRSSSSVLSISANDSGFASESDISAGAASTPVQNVAAPTVAAAAAVELDDSGVTLTDTRTLAEASRNLTQTLRKLSKEVFTNKIDLSSEETPRKSSSGAVIESMKNHGKGIYSGTFSGTLNPALQDRYGRPKRDISTVIHILNDLLSATPQYSRGAHISFEAPARSGASTSSAGHTSRSKQYGTKHHHHAYAQSVESCAKCISRSQNQSATGHSGSSASGCAYGECNGHYTAAVNKQSKHAAPYICCQDLSTASASHRHHHQTATDTNNSKERNICSCRYRVNSETGERVREPEHMCQKCLVEMENNKTKSKLDQLRLVMQQRKQKREARKLKGAPYGARVVGATTEVTSTEAGATVTATCTGTGGQQGTSSNSTGPPLTAAPLATASPSEVPPNHIVEEVDTAA